MLLAFAGAVSGYEGKFEFGAPGDEYGNTNYVGMRVVWSSTGATANLDSFVPFLELLVYRSASSQSMTSWTRPLPQA